MVFCRAFSGIVLFYARIFSRRRNSIDRTLYNTQMEREMKKIIFKIRYFLMVVKYYAKWYPFNPWGIARMNLAWTKYTETPMYEERKKIDFTMNPKYSDFAEEAFFEYGEMRLFDRLFTKKERFRVIFAPFSCGDKFKMPFWRVKCWIFGVKVD